MPRALSCSKGGLVIARHNYASEEWGALSDRALNPSFISYEPKINSRPVQGETNRDRDRVATGGHEGEGNEEVEGETGQEMVPDDSQKDLSVHVFWKWGTSALFDM